MNTNTSVEQTKEPSETISRIGWKAVVRFAIVALLPGVLFIAAGRLDWAMGWIFVGTLMAFTAISRIPAILKNPDLLAERARSLDAEDVKGWDKVIVAVAAMYGPLVMWIVAGLDERFGWSPQLALAIQLVALVFMALGYGLFSWAMASNKFFSAGVRIQKDRGHTVATGGPYQFVRHPGYVGAIVYLLAMPIMLGSLWTLIPAGLVVLFLIVRTALEDKTLLNELEGYQDYARRVRYRLLPGVW